MNLILGNSKIDVIKDPFKLPNIAYIRVSSSKNSYGYGWSHRGTVEFINGGTKGVQEFEGENFDAVVQKISVFLKTLEE